MARGDLVKSLFPGEPEPRSAAQDTVVRRERHAARSAKGGLRSLPRARGELDLLDVRDPELCFDDLVVDDERRRLFAEIHLEQKKEDLLVAHGVDPRRTMLFVGPPGSGKSATAEAFADELGRQFATVNLSTVVSSYLGDTAKNLSAIFEAARAEAWVVLFDEFDAIGKERADRTDHGELKRVVTAFLQRLERFTGPSVLIAATNHPDMLDLAIWRRFDEVLEFGFPSVHELRKTLRVKLRSIPREKRIDIEELAALSRGFSYADLDRAVQSAYRSQLLDDAEALLTQDQLEAAINHQAERPGVEAGVRDG